MEFKHFTPIRNIASTINPAFPFGANEYDYNNLQKNIPKFEQLAIQLGLNEAKAQIMKNTFNIGKMDTMTKIKDGRLGFPIFSNLVIKGDSYQNNAGITINSFSDVILDAILLEVSGENNIITTDIQGRQGTVIEYIGAKSNNIHVTGTILNNKKCIFPHDDVDNLKNALQSNKSLSINSWWLEMFGIKNIIIKNYSFKQEEGSQEYQRFEFEALSDIPIYLKVQKSNIDNNSGILIA